MKRLCLQVASDVESGLRIDKYLSDSCGLFTRSQLKTLLLEIRQDGRIVKPSKRVEPGTRLEISYNEPDSPNYAAEKIDLSILYEDSRVVVLDKQQGLVVHPGSGVKKGTLVQGLLHHVEALGKNFPGETVRPGIVHRLDKETSGVLVAAKDPEALEFLGRQFREKTVRKVYIAILKGRPGTNRGTIKGSIARDPGNRKRFVLADSGGKPSETSFRVMKSLDGYALVLLEPKTGRTHQLRVHMKSLGCPILGDPVYGRRDSRFPDAGLMLHAYLLTLRIPGESASRTFRASLPARFKDLIGILARPMV